MKTSETVKKIEQKSDGEIRAKEAREANAKTKEKTSKEKGKKKIKEEDAKTHEKVKKKASQKPKCPSCDTCGCSSHEGWCTKCGGGCKEGSRTTTSEEYSCLHGWHDNDKQDDVQEALRIALPKPEDSWVEDSTLGSRRLLASSSDQSATGQLLWLGQRIVQGRLLEAQQHFQKCVQVRSSGNCPNVMFETTNN